MSDPIRVLIRVGIVGAGFIGPVHIESLQRLGYVQVIALAARNQASAERKAAALSVPKAYGDYRDLVRDPGRYRAALTGMAERFLPYGRRFQIGQAINRSKWGVWNLREYAQLAQAAEEVLRRSPDVELIGPAVIDFEFHVTAAALNLRHAGFRFDAESPINDKPKDTKDYPEGVWTLPPTLTLGDKDRAKYLAIGESDRMTLRFVKPGK